MQRRKPRTLELARRAFVYAIMFSAVLVLVLILTLKVLGYQFNFETRSVEQTGLVQYASFPSGAMVHIDGRPYETTRTKSSILPGQHQFAMTLNGYENWQKTLSVDAGVVTWLSYVRLVPEAKKVESVQALPDLSGVVAAPDHRFMAGMMKTKGVHYLTLIDLRDSKRPKVVEHPFSVVYDKLEDKSVVSAEVVDWSGDVSSSRYFIIKYQYLDANKKKVTDWLWVDRDYPSRSVSVAELFGKGGASLRDVKADNERGVYVLDRVGNLRRINIDSGSKTGALVTKVLSFDIYKNDVISYIGEASDGKVAGVWKRGASKPFVIAKTPDSKSNIFITTSRYFSKDTVAVGAGSKVTFYRGELPTADESGMSFLQTAKSFTVNRPINSLSMSGTGRFIIAENNQGFVSYDLEHMVASRDIKKYNSATMRWLDDFHLWQIDGSGDLIMQDFDGFNEYKLTAATKGYDAALTRDGRFVYTFATNDKKELELVQLSMTLR